MPLLLLKPIKYNLKKLRQSLRDGVLITIKRIYEVLRGIAESDHYKIWIEKKKKTPETVLKIISEIGLFEYKPVISVIVRVYNTDSILLEKCINSVRNQYYPFWELSICDDHSANSETHGVLKYFENADPRIRIIYSADHLDKSRASNRAVENANGDFLGFLDHDHELTPDALFEIANALNIIRDIDVVYTDEDKIGPDNSFSDPLFKPDWSPELLYSCMYLLHFMVVRRSLFIAAGMFRSGFDGVHDYDLMLRLADMTKRIYHIPDVLYHGRAALDDHATPDISAKGRQALEDHIRRKHAEAEVICLPNRGLFRVKHRIKGSPLVSLLITTDDRELTVYRHGRINLLENFIKSISCKTEYKNYEIVVVDNGNLSEKTRNALKEINYRLVSYVTSHEKFNFSRKANFAFSHARGEQILLLNDDMEVISSEWIDALLEFSQQKEIGVVGGKLLFPDNRIQHAGVILGIGNAGIAGHIYCGYASQNLRQFCFPEAIRNYSAVTGACMMTRREVLNEVGGFDERFNIDYNDIDYCLSSIARGYRVVYTPFCELYHFEQSSLKNRAPDPQLGRLFLNKWGKYVANDPFYNPNLSREKTDYSVRIAGHDQSRNVK